MSRSAYKNIDVDLFTKNVLPPSAAQGVWRVRAGINVRAAGREGSSVTLCTRSPQDPDCQNSCQE